MRGQQGFTLIEVVVAFAIFALSASALFEVFASAGRRATQSRDQQLALLTAQTLLVERRKLHATWPPIEEGKIDGDTVWKIVAVPYDAKLHEDHKWQAFWVTVTIQNRLRSSRGVTLNSLEVASVR